MLNRRPIDAAPAERGSVVIAISVVMILATLSMTMLARTLATLASVRRAQDYSAALASADGGLAEALFNIENGNGTSFDNLATPGRLGGGEYTYKATKVDGRTWTIKARGLVNDVPHVIQATVTAEAAYPYAVFTQQTYDVNGNNASNIYSYNSATGAQHTGQALVGSNQAIEVNGGGTAGDEQHYYTPDGACTGCDNGVQKKGPQPNPDPAAPAAYQACPPGGVFAGSVHGAGGLPFLCNVDVTFSGVVTVANAPVVIYVGPGFTVDMSDATINRGNGTRAKDFRLLKAGDGIIDVRGLELTGVIYAPSADIPKIAGGKMVVDGSLTVNRLLVDGGPGFHVAYDDDLMTLVTEDWKVKDWSEIPSYSF